MTDDLSANIDFLIDTPNFNDGPASGLNTDDFGVLGIKNATGFAAGLRSDAQDRAGIAMPPVLPEPAKEPSLEIVIERSNFLPAWFLTIGARRASGVCKIKAAGTTHNGTVGQWSGTGFLVADDILLTNHHVINSPEVAEDASAIFNYELDEAGKPLTTKGFRLNPRRLFLTSQVGELDFTFVGVDGMPGQEFQHFKLDRSAFTVIDKEAANIIQHPGGDPKALTLQQNEIRGQDLTVLHYVSDTMPGTSGAPVCNNEWRLIALHHASKKVGDQVYNEGIKISAIAAYIERLAENAGDNAAAREVLRLFKGTDAVMGFFGTLGRKVQPGASDLERVVQTYQGEASDVDVAFWNIEWFTRRWEEKVDRVAEIVAQMNLDVWALEESSPEATDALVERLRSRYRLKFEAGYSEPDAAPGKQTTTVLWNTATVAGERREWPDAIKSWFSVDSRDFDELGLEAVEGRVFPRYPGLFHFQAKRNRGQEPFAFNLVPLHLKAMGEGSKRRQMASQILAAAIKQMLRDTDNDPDWVIGGDFNAALATQDFDKLIGGGMVPLNAEDEKGDAFSYLKRPRSLIDHIYLSANLARTYGAKDFFIVARDKTIPDYVRSISDHRPVLVRMALRDQEAARMEGQPGGGLPAELRELLRPVLVGAPPAGRQ